MVTAHSSFDYARADPQGHPRWGWCVGLGIILLMLAAFAFANLAVATVASVLFVGAMMTVGAVFQVIHAFQVKRWGGFTLWLLSGVLYGIAGVLILFDPILGAVTLTLLFAVSMLVSGVFRTVWGYKRRPLAGWGWMVASGVLTLLVGLLFLVQWPANALFLLGVVLAVDLTFQGVAWLVTGLELKRAAK